MSANSTLFVATIVLVVLAIMISFWATVLTGCAALAFSAATSGKSRV